MANSVSTSNVWPNYHSSNVNKAANRQPSDAMGKDQFLKILITQLTNQDPMQPMQDRDFIAQMAQFTSVEQLMNMSTELSMLRNNIGAASSIIGKHVQWFEYDERGEVVTMNGQVDAIVSKNGILFAKIGRDEVPIDYLISISETAPVPDDDVETEENENAGGENSENGTEENGIEGQ